jgi:hypothetical protein
MFISLQSHDNRPRWAPHPHFTRDPIQRGRQPARERQSQEDYNLATCEPTLLKNPSRSRAGTWVLSRVDMNVLAPRMTKGPLWTLSTACHSPTLSSYLALKISDLLFLWGPSLTHPFSFRTSCHQLLSPVIACPPSSHLHTLDYNLRPAGTRQRAWPRAGPHCFTL